DINIRFAGTAFVVGHQQFIDAAEIPAADPVLGPAAAERVAVRAQRAQIFGRPVDSGIEDKQIAAAVLVGVRHPETIAFLHTPSGNIFGCAAVVVAFAET